MKYARECASLESTERFGQVLGAKLKGGELIQLVGDVGTGKTTFVRGLVKGAGSSDHVSSPTFTICNTYQGRLTIQHCDFYRLHNDKLIEKELQELASSDSVLVLEWAENIKLVKQEQSIVITIKVINDEQRQFEVEASEKYNYLAL